jgi:hypothetical protein
MRDKVFLCMSCMCYTLKLNRTLLYHFEKTVCLSCYRASVTAVFNLEDGTEKQFTRIIKMQEHRSSAVCFNLVDNEVIILA